jgi:hypothetical protein
MERGMPEELLRAVVEQVSSADDLAALRRVSRAWRCRVDGLLARWVRRLPKGEQFAASERAGLWILESNRDGMENSFSYIFSVGVTII